MQVGGEAASAARWAEARRRSADSPPPPSRRSRRVEGRGIRRPQMRAGFSFCRFCVGHFLPVCRQVGAYCAGNRFFGDAGIRAKARGARETATTAPPPCRQRREEPRQQAGAYNRAGDKNRAETKRQKGQRQQRQHEQEDESRKDERGKERKREEGKETWQTSQPRKAPRHTSGHCRKAPEGHTGAAALTQGGADAPDRGVQAAQERREERPTNAEA